LRQSIMPRFLLQFLGILCALFAFEIWQPVRESVVMPYTESLARLSAAFIRPLDQNVANAGRVLQNTASGFGVSIESGCNGVETAIFLIAAIFAFRAPLRQKLAGAAIGVCTIQLLNLVRIISLFYLGQWNRPLFEWAHLYLWQVLMMVDVLAVWLLWLRWVPETGGRRICGELVVSAT
jgi:exosortase H (IPTLxxWG-CTERM-specific)